jgi:hypothetical protein
VALNKLSLKSDGIADLYRAALYLARGSKRVGLSFVEKAQRKLGKKISLDLGSLKNGNILEKHSDYIYWAEKILDEYKRLK